MLLLGIAIDTATVAFFFLHQRLLRVDLLHHHLAAIGKEVNLAGNVQAQVFRHDGDVFLRQEGTHETGVALADIDRGHAGNDVAAAEYLGFQGATVSTQLQHVVDQQFHGMGTETGRHQAVAVTAALVWQHEVVHAGDAGLAVTQAGRDTGAEYGHQQQAVLRSLVLPRQQFGGRTVEMLVEIAVFGGTRACHTPPSLLLLPAR